MIVVLHFYFETFVQGGLDQLWVRAGLYSYTRFIPLHTLHQKQRPNVVEILPALQSLIGTDMTSKVG